MMTVTKSSFGRTSDGEAADLYTLTNKNKMSVSISSFGGAIQKILIPTAQKDVDVVLGYDDVSGYEKRIAYIGSIIGRVGNRIEKGRFTLNGKEYNLYLNNNGNHLHGGKVGFNKKMWEVKEVSNSEIQLSYTSPDGEEGYPGELAVFVNYRLVPCNTLMVTYRAYTTKDTLCNLTNHSYFNLSGYDSGEVGDQTVQLFADAYTATDEKLIPHGEIIKVDGTPMDLRKPKAIKDGWDSDYEAIKVAGGYDHNFVVPEYNGNTKVIAKAHSNKTNITMTVMSNLPGFQFYTGNSLKAEMHGKNDVPLARRTGYCFETQYFPNAVNVPSFITPILRAGNIYKAGVSYHFDVK